MNDGSLAISISCPSGHDTRLWFSAFSISGSKIRAIDIHRHPSEIYIAQHTRLLCPNNHHTATTLQKTLGAHRFVCTVPLSPIHSDLPAFPETVQTKRRQTPHHAVCMLIFPSSPSPRLPCEPAGDTNSTTSLRTEESCAVVIKLNRRYLLAPPKRLCASQSRNFHRKM